MVNKVFQYGDTVYIALRHKHYTLLTDTWALADSDEGFPVISIRSPEGTLLVTAAAMTKVGVGLYEYFYVVPDDIEGQWVGFIDTEDGSYPTRSFFSFTVKG
jgi:DNA-binding transcriptional LysR family regulator